MRLRFFSAPFLSPLHSRPPLNPSSGGVMDAQAAQSERQVRKKTEAEYSVKQVVVVHFHLVIYGQSFCYPSGEISPL